MIKRISQLMCCLFLCSNLAIGQTIKAVVADAESHQAIPDVFVFLDNSFDNSDSWLIPFKFIIFSKILILFSSFCIYSNNKKEA